MADGIADRFHIILHSWLVRLLVRFVVIPVVMGIVGFVIVSRVTNWFSGPDPCVYFVGQLDDKTVQQIRGALEDSLNNFKLKIDGKPLQFKARDDRGDAQEAQRQSLDIASQDDVLMVVGHCLSTTTKAALPSYLTRIPLIPVILTTETNPDLLPPNLIQGSFCPVFRLSPTDKDQAARAADYAVDTLKAATFWAIQDPENSVYSKYLVGEFIQRLQEKKKGVVVSSIGTAPLPLDAIKALDIDCVFFAGGYSNGIILVRQIRRLVQNGKMSSPKIILSDWCGDSRFIEHGGSEVENVYITHPRRPKEFTEHGYEYYGRDTAAIIKKLVMKSETTLSERKSLFKRLLNMHRVTDARSAIIETMADFFQDQTVLDVADCRGSQEKYQFKNPGERVGGKFYVWQVQRIPCHCPESLPGCSESELGKTWCGQFGQAVP